MSRFDYDVMVIGGGGGGITAALTANGLGKKVVMIEKNKLGGECTWSGCVPSKALIRAASMVNKIKNIEDFGIDMEGNYKINSKNVMRYVQSVIEKVYKEEKPEVFEGKGIHIIIGEASFIDQHHVVVKDKKISAQKIIIATGTSPFIPPIPGIQETNYVTNETIFKIKELPDSMIVIGGGAIGVELAQALNRLGVEITILLRGDQILVREEKELVDILTKKLIKEGIQLVTKAKIIGCENEKDKVAIAIEKEDKEILITGDRVLVATGRKPNLTKLMLDGVGVKYSKKGIITNSMMQTSVSHIFACGDIAGPYQFSHMAGYQGMIAGLNACLPIKRKADYSNVLWCTFTDPELAHVGLTEKEAIEKYGDDIKVYRQEYKNLDRAKTDGTEEGMAKFICDRKGKILGAHILGERAGELIHEGQLLKSLHLPIQKAQSIIHAYPTYSDLTKKIGQQVYIDRLENNMIIKNLKKLF